MTDNNLAAMLQQAESIADAPASHWAIARERLLNLAPDLYECVIGEVA